MFYKHSHVKLGTAFFLLNTTLFCSLTSNGALLLYRVYLGDMSSSSSSMGRSYRSSRKLPGTSMAGTCSPALPCSLAQALCSQLRLKL